MKLIICLITALVIATPAAAFEVGQVSFKNSLRILQEYKDVETYDKELIHAVRIFKKGVPITLFNKYQVHVDDLGDLQDNKYQVRTNLVYHVLPRIGIVIERHEYSYKKTNNLVHRVGFELRF